MVGRIMGFSQFGREDSYSREKQCKFVTFTKGTRYLDRSFQTDYKSINTWTDAYRTVKSFYSDRKVPTIEFTYD